MGYSKYKEDIEKIYSMNIFGTPLDLQPRPVLPIHRCGFCSFEANDREIRDAHILKEHREAAIYLEYDDHIVPDRAVFTVRPIHLKVRCPALPKGVEASVSSRSQAASTRHFKDGALLKITPPDEEVVTLQLGIGAYKRHYDISFRHQTFVARLTPTLAKQLKSANSQISSWEWADVDKFKAVLLGEPGMSEVDKMHRHGIFEYYHALWLEQNRKLEYTQHFEEAFNCLRNFGDPLSQLIVSYFWYRVNAFDSISTLIPFPRLRQVVAFFAGPFNDSMRCESGKPKQPDGEYISCEIAIADADASVFAAVSAIQAFDLETAICDCDYAEPRMLPTDDQARHRISFLRCRAHRLLGQTSEARRLAERLRVCGIKSFQSEAEHYLSSI
jgi:hypothetical protein